MYAINHSAGPGQRGVSRRLLIALTASFCAHYLIVSGWTGSSRAGHPEIMQAYLQARLVSLLPSMEVIEEAEAETETAAMPPTAANAPSVQAVSMPLHVPAATMTAATRSKTLAAAEVREVDTRFYLARELDRYPQPLSALGLDEHASAGAVEGVRLWVSIDQAGAVVDAVVINAETSGASGYFARDRVLATRFVPARRDGQAVKSRVLLVLHGGG